MQEKLTGNYKKAIYSGTFDPITIGHMDIIIKASKIFDEVIVAVAKSQKKSPMFPHEKRIEFAKMAIKNIPNVNVVGFDTLLVDLATKLDVTAIIRGLRAVSDFEYEFQMGYANSSINKNIETLYLMPTLENAFVSSSIVREIISFNGKYEHLIPKEILKCI